MRVNPASKKQGKHKSCQIKRSFSDGESWVESEHYVNLKNEDKNL